MVVAELLEIPMSVHTLHIAVTFEHLINEIEQIQYMFCKFIVNQIFYIEFTININ